MPWISTDITKEQGNSSLNPWQMLEVIGADVFTINNSNFLQVVDYHRKLPIVK